MTVTDPLTPYLDEFFSTSDGESSTGLPDEVELPLANLQAHPFIWALDSYVFAGPDAHIATRTYAHAASVQSLRVTAWKIMDTVDGVMTLTRV